MLKLPDLTMLLPATSSRAAVLEITGRIIETMRQHAVEHLFDLECFDQIGREQDLLWRGEQGVG